MLESMVDKNHLEILKLLKKANGKYVSGEKISKNVKVSRAAIWKQVSGLRKYGYRIESKEGSGYKLHRSTNQLLPWEIRDGLKTKFVGKEIHHYAVIDS
ncbi:MAG: biotin operon repressor, partial [Nitrososphaerales archaeon]